VREREREREREIKREIKRETRDCGDGNKERRRECEYPLMWRPRTGLSDADDRVQSSGFFA